MEVGGPGPTDGGGAAAVDVGADVFVPGEYRGWWGGRRHEKPGAGISGGDDVGGHQGKRGPESELAGVGTADRSSSHRQ